MFLHINSKNNTSVNEWKLVYTPTNDILKSLMDATINLLNMDGAVAVDTSEQIEQAMYNEKFVAGIEFDNVLVNILIALHVKNLRFIENFFLILTRILQNFQKISFIIYGYPVNFNLRIMVKNHIIIAKDFYRYNMQLHALLSHKNVTNAMVFCPKFKCKNIQI